MKTLAIVRSGPIVVAQHLFIEIPEQVERLDIHMRADVAYPDHGQS